MTHDDDLLFLIRDRMASLTRNQRRLAEFILSDQRTVAFSTVQELAQHTAISAASIVRFAKALGFEGYNGLQREMRRRARTDLRGPDRFRQAARVGAGGTGALQAAIAGEMANIAALEDTVDAEAFAAAAGWLAQASAIVVVGTRSAAALADHLGFGLNKAGLAAEPARSVDVRAYERIDRLDGQGCVFAIGFPRYLAAMAGIIQFAREAGKRVIVLTDSPFSPFRGDVTLYAPVESASFVAFHAAPLILISALLSEVAAQRPDRTLQALDRFEELAERTGLFKPAHSRE